MSNKKPGLFCPSCLQHRPDVRSTDLRATGLDPWAHRGFFYRGSTIRPHGIVRRGIFRFPVTIHRRPSTVGWGGRSMGRTWATCSHVWHEQVAKMYTVYGEPINQRPEPRPRTERPKRDQIKDRHKDKARRHKARQANR